jgi:hypothetical protein
MTDFNAALRHYCRNPKCRSKLKQPVDNAHRAFCCRGCHDSFHLKRCLVCEAEKPPRSTARRKLCRRPKCQARYRQNRALYSFPGPGTGRTANVVRNLDKSGVKRGAFGDRASALPPDEVRSPFWRGWHLSRTGKQWWLYDRDGRAAVVLQHEAQRFVIIRPHCIPKRSAPTLNEAFRLAKTVALWGLPLNLATAARLNAANDSRHIKRETAGSRRTAEVTEPVSKPPIATHSPPIPDDLSIPDFLRR